MEFKTLTGRLVKKNYARYYIKWENPSRSKLQFRVKQLLKPIWFAHVVYEEFPLVGTRLKVDFLNLTLRVAIEVQGRQHTDFVPFFHRDRYGFGHSLERDYDKMRWLELNNIRLVEIIDKDLNDLNDFYNRVI